VFNKGNADVLIQTLDRILQEDWASPESSERNKTSI